jgi:hypothetical protein
VELEAGFTWEHRHVGWWSQDEVVIGNDILHVGCGQEWKRAAAPSALLVLLIGDATWGWAETGREVKEEEAGDVTRWRHTFDKFRIFPIMLFNRFTQLWSWEGRTQPV